MADVLAHVGVVVREQDARPSGLCLALRCTSDSLVAILVCVAVQPGGHFFRECLWHQTWYRRCPPRLLQDSPTQEPGFHRHADFECRTFPTALVAVIDPLW